MTGYARQVCLTFVFVFVVMRDSFPSFAHHDVPPVPSYHEAKEK